MCNGGYKAWCNSGIMDIDEIEAKVTDKTKAIMIVHLYGLLVEVDKVLALAEKYHLKVIEDAAAMHGQSYCGRPCGSFGDISIFRFSSNKLVAAGEEGMVVTDDDNLAERCRMFRNLCFRKDARYIHDEISDNYRFNLDGRTLCETDYTSWTSYFIARAV